VDTVYRVCYSYLRNSSDCEDAVQAVFLKYMVNPKSFQSIEHEKAWLIRVAVNHCKDQLKSAWNKRSDLESIPEPAIEDKQPDEVLEYVMSLPENLRVSIYLYYYEGYNAAKIAELLGYNHSTVRSYLSEARKLLKQKLVGFDD
jgi:RNA polymerase sigma-70 factor (ECF subfamily)